MDYKLYVSATKIHIKHVIHYTKFSLYIQIYTIDSVFCAICKCYGRLSQKCVMDSDKSPDRKQRTSVPLTQ